MKLPPGKSVKMTVCSVPAHLPIVRDVEWKDKDAVVDVQGDIDLGTSTGFQRSLLSLMDKKPARIVVNLSKVPYMDSSGVASLVKVLSRARKSGISLVLTGLTGRVRNVFEITKLDHVFTIKPSDEEALA
jgi:anti-sigma B factor antagonist